MVGIYVGSSDSSDVGKDVGEFVYSRRVGKPVGVGVLDTIGNSVGGLVKLSDGVCVGDCNEGVSVRRVGMKVGVNVANISIVGM